MFTNIISFFLSHAIKKKDHSLSTWLINIIIKKGNSHEAINVSHSKCFLCTNKFQNLQI